MRKWLYHKDAEATIFKGDEAIKKALKEGWVESPKDLEAVTIDAKVVKRQAKKPIKE